MQTSNGWCGVKLERVSLSQAQQLVMLQYPQSHGSIQREKDPPPALVLHNCLPGNNYF